MTPAATTLAIFAIAFALFVVDFLPMGLRQKGQQL